MKNFNIPSDADGILFVVSTSHMDWDWNAAFEQYYSSGLPSTVSVRFILDQALSLINANGGYQYNLAEIAWLQRYMLDNPSNPPSAAMLGSLYFLGGGITSPDNLVCNGEAFIRNYLLGRTYVKSLGLGSLISDVCWIPDDFGQDPQLPVVLTAMGMTGVSFWRVPGNEPAPPADYHPTDPFTPPLSDQLASSGVTFNWEAADGSVILTQQMSGGYGVVWDQASPSIDNAEDLDNFVTTQNVLYPGNLYMAPCGGDFSQPSQNLVDAVNLYNTDYYPGQATKIYAVMATFHDYIDELNSYISQSPGNALQTIQNFDASNFWTGHFASRVQLKINQQRTVNQLMAAETLSTLLHVYSNYSGSLLSGLNDAISAGWNNLVPSTHHDYVNGTSPDNIYWAEQLPLSQLALDQAECSVHQAMKLLGRAINASSASDSEFPFVIFNPSGFSRSGIGNLVEIERSKIPADITSYRIGNSMAVTSVQTLKNGSILLPYPGLNSMGYGCVNLMRGLTALQTKPAKEPAAQSTSYTFDNGVVQITINQSNAWAISSIKDVSTGVEVIMPGDLYNQLMVYYENPVNSGSDQGNIYQMGNELYPKNTNGDGFFADSSSYFTGLAGEMNEEGPYRWHFIGKVNNKDNSLDCIIEYILEYNEPLVRVKVTGNATNSAESANTVVSVSGVTDDFGGKPGGMNYGTANHWANDSTVPYWHGPTFKSTHDYITVYATAGGPDSAPLVAFYHEAMRAWALNSDGQMLGVLFRNAPGNNRGAKGTDTAVHTQHFAFRIPGVGAPQSCQPLMEATAFQQPLLAAPIITTSAALNKMPETGFLAEMGEQNAMIRVARTQPGSGGTETNAGPATVPLPFSFVLRIYQASNSTADTWSVNVPFLSARGSSNAANVSLVTALEEEPAVQAQLQVSGNNITIPAMPTLATLRILTKSTMPLT